MMRLLGFVTGAAGVIGATVMLLGAPAVQETAEVEATQPATAAPEPIEKLAGDYDVPVPVAEPLPETPTNTEPESDRPVEAVDENATVAESLWHPFWQPFRSQIAANGFASRLAAITDIDYRVLRLERGAYQVAFAYADEAERNTNLTQIESSTGLRIAEASP